MDVHKETNTGVRALLFLLAFHFGFFLVAHFREIRALERIEKSTLATQQALSSELAETKKERYRAEVLLQGAYTQVMEFTGKIVALQEIVEEQGRRLQDRQTVKHAAQQQAGVLDAEWDPDVGHMMWPLAGVDQK